MFISLLICLLERFGVIDTNCCCSFGLRIQGTKEEVKREKKGRKHNKVQKRKERDNDAGRSRNHRHKRQRKDESANASKKVESLEKSCLTIELDHQSSSQTSCDSTLRSNENEEPNHIKSQPLNGRHN